MNATSRRAGRIAIATAAAATLAMTAAACSGGSSGSKGSSSSTTASSAPSTPAGSTAAMPSADKPFGPACSTIPKTGKGSFNGMATDPVATAASNNPALSTLVTAVKKAGLVDTLNSAQNITVFAPDNAAFAKLPKATLAKVLANKAMLTKILTYHVVGKQLAVSDLASGTYPTLEKQNLMTSGSGMSYKVNNTANVVCGNVKTANANVEIIDTVLMPPSS
ncbi:fasciclin domain-containing protein [Streptomyces sp. SL13]|uniref:Fasciclin domain-containing protein n=1 Tax=Streptantibioticus silvisoli TaxID=2705255 RepID=A0AA90H1U4_9ACTN|nr:fasciclin domain-containing protein [Streptantibioticus silvisoli]MDI5961954.1 fasciclin domain-containing protein [Streptantibioticus silvisoli]MDI5970506.1 fasciclin domain-containing protein [Streptantibioticus silvisoli]